jgi:hypothetical protein
MKFDSRKFLKTKFEKRSYPVPVPDLQAFFPEGEEAVWIVRGLTGQELGRAEAAADRNKNIAAVVAGLTADNSREKAAAIKDLLGIGGDTPEAIVKRIEQLMMASVDPVCTRDLAVKLCETYPVEFLMITNKIVELTGQGQVPGKLPPSGVTAASGQVLPSATPEGDSCMSPGPTSSRKDT